MLHPKMCIDKPEIPKPCLVCYYFGTIYVSITDSYKLCHKNGNRSICNEKVSLYSYKVLDFALL